MKKNKLFMYLVVIVALLVIAIPLSGCTSSGNTAGTTAAATTAAGTTAAETNPESKNEIIIESNTFKPDKVTIKVGDTITWVNNDTYAHTVNASNGEFDSGNMASGATFSFTFDKDGTYDYICGIHTFMKGTIIVTK